MVLEGLVNPSKAEGKNSHLIFYGFVYGIVAYFLSLWVFSSHASTIMIFLTVMAALPLVHKIITKEEELDLETNNEKDLLKHHWKCLRAFMYLFIGFTLAYTLAYVITPNAQINNVFEAQNIALSNNNVKTTGYLSNNSSNLIRIVLNNIKVLLFSLLFSLIFGSGALFILTWNASVIGVAIGILIKSGTAKLAGLTGFAFFSKYVGITLYGLARYCIHGLPEILSYFIAGLAGGIISIAIIKHDFMSEKFNNIINDSTDLILISIFLVIVSGIIEVFITPIIF